jgi:hypothetical protein
MNESKLVKYLDRRADKFDINIKRKKRAYKNNNVPITRQAK